MEKEKLQKLRDYIMGNFEMRLIVTFVLIFLSIIILCGCTISFQNISTHGTATDLVDQDQKADADVKPVIELPVGAI